MLPGKAVFFMKDSSPNLIHEQLLDLASKIRVLGEEETKLSPDKRLVVDIMRELVVDVIEKNRGNFFMVRTLRELPVGSNVLLFHENWLNVFTEEDPMYFSEDDLELELAQITGEDPDNKMTIFESLSSRVRLTGLAEKDMNEYRITGQARVALFEAALTGGKLGIKFTGEKIVSCFKESGPVVIGRKL